ncbi:MAG: PP2C family protein-serine/threonine phosphatase [Ignavibacteriaceae bacterium]
MDQRKLHKTVENIASQKFSTDEEMLISTINQLVIDENINVTGGRIWQLNPQQKEYKLLFQTGTIEKIDDDFSLKLDENSILEFISKERTILGRETNEVLKQKGIFKYSASGVGEKIRIDGKLYYEFILALNSKDLDEQFKLTLNIIATALTSQIKQKKYSVKANLLRADIDKARELQKSILPEHEYRFHNYELFGITQPAEIVGGDFFDYLEVGADKDKLGVVVADAASKGVSAAAEAMYISGALRMASSFEIKIASLMKRMNQLVNQIFADDKFASLFYGELSTDLGGLFLYANAGHNPPLFVRNKTDEVIELATTGILLGPMPNAKYTVENINFAKGDVLLIFSDGLTDTTDSSFHDYGEKRVIEQLKKLKNQSPKEIVYALLEDVIKFSKDGKYNDDKTLVVIKRVK